MEEDVTTDGHVSSRIEGETTCYTRGHLLKQLFVPSSVPREYFNPCDWTKLPSEDECLGVCVCVCVWRTERHTSEEETRSLRNATRIHVELFLARLPTAMPAWATGL